MNASINTNLQNTFLHWYAVKTSFEEQEGTKNNEKLKYSEERLAQ